MSLRVYLPATVASARAALLAGRLPAPLTGFAVTPGLREMYLGDHEELEYHAQLLAARASLRLLDAHPQARRRRVVLAADVADSEVTVRDDEEPGTVQIAPGVRWRQVQAGLVDDAGAEPAVTAAAAAILAADLGDPDAEFTLGEVEGHELAWWAAQELPGLFERLG